MAKEKKKVPNLRFKGFTDDWEQRKLGELGSVQMNKRIFKNQTSESGDVPFYKIGTFGKKADAYISNSLYQDYKEKYPYPNKGDLLISASGSIGRIVEYKGQKAYYQDSNIVWLEHNNHVLNSFLKAFYQIVKWDGTEGSTIKRLYNKNILNTKIKLPKVKEQKVLGTLISTVDLLISLQQRKLDLLKQLKKGLLQKMFADKDSKRPVLRFKGFHDDWEQRKLVSLFSKFTDGDWIESKDQANTGIRLIQTGNIGITEFINKFGNEKWISEETFKKLNCEEIFPGDIIISRLPDPAGRACILPKLDTRMITAVDCTIARTSREASAEFIVQYLSTQTYFKYVQSCLAGGTRQRISRKNLANFNVSIPTEINEQKQIGFFFKQLDTLIALHQRKQNHLKLLKKSLLQQMFM